MGSEFNGMKFDIWSDYSDDPKEMEFGVWSNDMRARQWIFDWMGTVAPNKQAALEKARAMNAAYEKLKGHSHD